MSLTAGKLHDMWKAVSAANAHQQQLSANAIANAAMNRIFYNQLPLTTTGTGVSYIEFFDQPPPAVVAPPLPNLAWLDRRVNEMRVRL